MSGGGNGSMGSRESATLLGRFMRRPPERGEYRADFQEALSRAAVVDVSEAFAYLWDEARGGEEVGCSGVPDLRLPSSDPWFLEGKAPRRGLPAALVRGTRLLTWDDARFARLGFFCWYSEDPAVVAGHFRGTGAPFEGRRPSSCACRSWSAGAVTSGGRASCGAYRSTPTAGS